MSYEKNIIKQYYVNNIGKLRKWEGEKALPQNLWSFYFHLVKVIHLVIWKKKKNSRGFCHGIEIYQLGYIQLKLKKGLKMEETSKNNYVIKIWGSKHLQSSGRVLWGQP